MQATQRRTILITGANKGIGYVSAEKFFSDSAPYDIILTSRDVKLGEKAIETLKNKYPNSSNTLIYQQLEVNDEKSVDNLVNWVKTSNKKIDVLINNAAIHYWEANEEQRKFTIKTNFLSVVNITEKLLPYLSEDAKILQISSFIGQLAYQGPKLQKALTDPTLTQQGLIDIANNFIEITSDFKENFPAVEPSYPGSKALLNFYVKNFLPAKLKPNQQVYAVHPGWVQTDMGGSGAPQPLEEGADNIVYLTNLPYKVNPEINAKLIADKKVLEF